MVTLDTNVIIYFLKGDQGLRRIFTEEIRGRPVFVSTITESELFAYPYLSEEEERSIDSFLRYSVLVPVDSRVARMAAGFRRKKNIGLGDSLIAATAVIRTHLKNGFEGEIERISSRVRCRRGDSYQRYDESREGGFAEIRRLEPKCIFEMGSTQSTLFTRNTKDFQKIPELDLRKI